MKGSFLHGELDEGANTIYMVVLEVFEDIYRIDMVLMLNKKNELKR